MFEPACTAEFIGSRVPLAPAPLIAEFLTGVPAALAYGALARTSTRPAVTADPTTAGSTR